ncbi:MAG: argininosuccinate lyase [Promethearchaeota archaeon]|nr:MAG: argininosuccinate lyase [Candidatus Lokiarchaeota archaeon]
MNKTSEKLIELINVLFKRSEETINAFMPLYTHLQGGQLGVFAHYLNNYVSQILRSLVRIEEIYFRVNFNPLGACSIGGTNIKIDRNRTTELLGFYEPIENSIDAISSRDYIIETLMCLALISVQFSRIAEDLLIWSTKEFQFIELSDEFCSVSSVMPQKKNPDTIEMIRSKCSKLISNLFSALVIVKAIPSGYFRDFQELKTVLRNSFDTLFNIIEMLIGIFDTIQIKEKNMIENINDSYILALDLAEYLVEHHDIPFRVSHEIVANLVKNSTNPRDFLKKREIEALVLKIYNKKIELPDEFSELKKDLDFWLGKRISKGSPSKSQIKETLQLLNQKKVTIMKKYNERIEHIKKSTKIRENLIKSLMA